MWSDPEIKLLIEERRNKNENYWEMAGMVIFIWIGYVYLIIIYFFLKKNWSLYKGSSKLAFWMEVAGKINCSFTKSYTPVQCKEKFQNLVREHTVRKIIKCCNRKLNLHFFSFFWLISWWRSIYEEKEAEKLLKMEKNITMTL